MDDNKKMEVFNTMSHNTRKDLFLGMSIWVIVGYLIWEVIKATVGFLAWKGLETWWDSWKNKEKTS